MQAVPVVEEVVEAPVLEEMVAMEEAHLLPVQPVQPGHPQLQVL
jgi:hypothetical protein